MLYESGEDYLETIYLLTKKNKIVRSIDIANEFGYSKPSITRAMEKLSEQGYIIKNEHNHILLTEQGLQLAQEVYERHLLLRTYFEKILGIPHDIADHDACKIEHVISKETLQAMKEAIQKIEP